MASKDIIGSRIDTAQSEVAIEACIGYTRAAEIVSSRIYFGCSMTAYILSVQSSVSPDAFKTAV